MTALGDRDNVDLSTLPPYVLALKERIAYLPEAQVQRVLLAYEIGARAHLGQSRKSGEPYITHPVAVAGILAELGLDTETIIAAILHDTLEDTELSREALAGEFGEEVAELVDGVTKLDKMRFGSRQEADAESFRKMLLAMARDLRVILIKLADRLHNMRTLGAKDSASRRRIARETLEIYAPIAQRLGMNKFKAELQDLGFRTLYPDRYRVIRERIRAALGNRREAMGKIESALAARLASDHLTVRVVGRIKSPWSIYSKMRNEHKSFAQLMDVYGFRVITDSVMSCYMALGVVHALYKPVDRRFKDFIAIPKANGYQSLHTVLLGPFGAPIEVQLRTAEMDSFAESGVAAHWAYKTESSPANSAQARAREWLSSLADSQMNTTSSAEFIENVKIDLFPDEVYLFTPRGDILSLPRNATALDFAYAVHTDVGDHAVAARVDKKLLPLRTRLESGQLVEIITAPSALPNPAWLESVVTGKARTAIRHQLKQLEHEDAVQLGHRMLDRALERLETSLDRLPPERMDAYLDDNRYPRLEALLADIALGNRMPAQVAQALTRDEGGTLDLLDTAAMPRSGDRILITGNERGIITFASCCMPIPGDEIMGYHTTGRGIMVHRMECPNVADYRKSPERWVAIGWDRDVSGDFGAALKVEVENSPGVLAQVAAAIAEANSNIDGVENLERDANVATIRVSIEVKGRKHLADVIRRTRRLQVVHGVQRL
jgi:guanosine-3',5'-bis(diphosphate) 3'-pyrophosphohydrolase